MHYFSNNFPKSPSAGGSPLQRHLIFDFGDLELRNLAKLWFFELIMMKPNLKNQLYVVISVTSSLLIHQKSSPK